MAAIDELKTAVDTMASDETAAQTKLAEYVTAIAELQKVAAASAAATANETVPLAEVQAQIQRMQAAHNDLLAALTADIPPSSPTATPGVPVGGGPVGGTSPTTTPVSGTAGGGSTPAAPTTDTGTSTSAPADPTTAP